MKQVFAGEHLVAVRTHNANCTDLREKSLKAPAHAAVAVHDYQSFVTRPQCIQLLSELIDDAGWIEVEEGRDSVNVHVPAAAVDDALHFGAERSANHERCRLHPTSSRWGNCSTATNVSLKSARPESSMYSMRDGRAKATWRPR